ncbi:MAG: hypothetical protein QOF09_278 [Alphaproteobacteria bacterium]|jgi:hypothetical protein|nr:hypothetical protein [Alphaproteobacteria bacterium]
MIRFVAAAGAAATCLLLATSAQPVAAPDARSLPMQFELWTEGPAQACGNDCRTWVSASGAITSDTPRDFEAFAKRNSVDGFTVALDSDGGSVLGALALGRAIRKLGMTTTVGKTIDLGATDGGKKRAKLQARAYCESMCAFVLLAGVERRVPAEARVMVHQIWLGDRRDDPTAASYSAEDLVVVQRDIGRLARYTFEMGGGVDLLEIALKIPPWEPMRMLSRDELRTMKVMTAGDAPEVNSGAATNSAALANGTRATANGQGWAMMAVEGRPALGRTHPLTVEGDEVGTFELKFACGEPGRDYIVTYIEQRRGDEPGHAPAVLSEVEISLAGKPVQLKVVASRPRDGSSELNSIASGRVSAEVLKAFADPGSRSLMVETASDDAVTAIRIGNAGISRVLPLLAASCASATPPIRNSARNSVRQGG